MKASSGLGRGRSSTSWRPRSTATWSVPGPEKLVVRKTVAPTGSCLATWRPEGEEVVRRALLKTIFIREATAASPFGASAPASSPLTGCCASSPSVVARDRAESAALASSVFRVRGNTVSVPPPPARAAPFHWTVGVIRPGPQFRASVLLPTFWVPRTTTAPRAGTIRPPRVTARQVMAGPSP